MNVKFVPNQSGIEELLSSAKMHQIVDDKADEICAKANQMARNNTKHPHLDVDPYMANKNRQGRYALANVATANDVGKWDASTNNTLMKAKG